MRIAAGILIIIGGLIGGSIWSSISGELVSDFLQTVRVADPLSTAVVLGFPVALLRFLPMFLAVIGGIEALRRKHWRWALAGAIFSLLFPFTGIPAIILLAKRKGEFFSRETAIRDDERHECLTYYKEEKKLRLLYERVEQLFDKRLGIYEDAYFKARRARREFWPYMDKIIGVGECIAEAATEIIKRKKEMRPTLF